jgi:hypothetical protein
MNEMLTGHTTRRFGTRDDLSSTERATDRMAAGRDPHRVRPRLSRPIRTLRTCWSLAATLLLAATANSQHLTTGSIAGRVLGEEGRPLAGATVVVTSPQGATTLATDVAGRFLVPYVAPGSCVVRAEMPGYRAAERRDLDVRLGQRIELEITLAPGAFTETVDVTGATPTLDLGSSTLGLTVGTDTLARVPVGRLLAETIYLAPGVSSSGGAGRSNPSISGASGLENQYVVDGVNITNARYGALGVYSSQYGSLGNGVSYDFIDEVQVRTAGAGADAEQSTGGLVSVITKSGSNQLHGSVFTYISPASLEGDRPTLTLVNGAVNTTGESSSELGFTLGGPLVRDRVFYFVAAGRRDQTTTFLAPKGFPLRALGEVDRDRTVHSYAGKLTWLPSEDHRLELSAFGDPTHGENGPQSADAMLFRSPSAFSALDYGGHNQGFQYQGVLRPEWLVEGSFSHAASSFTEHVSVDQWQVTDNTVIPVEISGGKGRYEATNDGDSLQLHARSTHLLARHELSYGFGNERTTADSTRTTTGPTVLLADGRTTAGGALVSILPDPAFGRIYRVTRAELERVRTSTAHYANAFLQDRVALSTSLTLSAGLRWERQELAGSAASFTFGDDWAPRLGLVWDPSGTGRTKLSASWGVYPARIPNGIAVTLLGGAGRVLRADYFDAGLTDPVPDGVDAGGSTRHLILSNTSPALIDPSARVTSSDESTVAFEWVAASDLVVGVRYLHSDMTRVLEDVTTASLWLTYVGTDNVDYLVTNPRADYPPTVDGIGRFVDPVRRYDAVELTAEKRFSHHWSLLASYRWSRLVGNYEGFYRNDAQQSLPALTGIFDFPPDDPTYAEIGVPQEGFRGDIRYLAEVRPLPNDRPHQIKLYGTYRFDSGISLGAAFQGSSGRPLTPMAASPVYGRAGEIPEAPRGSGIATEDGFLRRTPTEWTLDIHLDYELPLKTGRLVFLADVFNIFDRGGVTDYDQNTERTFGVLNPDFGRRIAYQDPRQIRLAVRFEL